MTIAGKLNLIYLAAVLLLSSVLLSIAADREYQMQLQTAVANAEITSASSIEFQVEIYAREEQQLRARLDKFLQTLVAGAAAYDSLGQVLAQAPNGNPAVPVDFRALRFGLSPADTGIVRLDKGNPTPELGLWSALWSQDSFVHVTLPVLSAVNPTEKDIHPIAFAAALINPQSVNSRVVMGYVHVLVSQSRLLEAAISSMFGLILLYSAIRFVDWRHGSAG